MDVAALGGLFPNAWELGAVLSGVPSPCPRLALSDASRRIAGAISLAGRCSAPFAATPPASLTVVVTALNPMLADRLRVPGSRGEVSIMVLPAPLARMPATRGLRGGWDEPFGTRRAAELVPTVSAIGAKHVSIHWSLGLSFYS